MTMWIESRGGSKVSAWRCRQSNGIRCAESDSALLFFKLERVIRHHNRAILPDVQQQARRHEACKQRTAAVADEGERDAGHGHELQGDHDIYECLTRE